MNTVSRPRAAGLLALIAGLLASGCSDGPAGPGAAPEPPTVPGLVVSEAITGIPRSDGGDGLSYVSLAPGSLPTGASVRIRNSTTDFDALPVPVIDGGFDPVTIPASTGDRLELIITDAASGTRTEIATVPVGRAPVIVRTILAGDLSEVPVDASLRAVFSEPINESSLRTAVRLASTAGSARLEVALDADEPWVVDIVPTLGMDPLSTYELVFTDHIQDLNGDRLVNFVSETFTTAGSLGVEGQIAFSSTRDGGPHIYLMQADGTGLRKLALGASPAWSPDSRRIAFHLQIGDWDAYTSDVIVIGVDGSGELVVASGGTEPAWSHDGTRLAFVRGGEIFVVNADGSGETLLVGGDAVEAATGVRYMLGAPDFSPDGTRLAFTGFHPQGATREHILVAAADGSAIDLFPLSPRPAGFLADPTWWGDESRLAFTVGDSVASAALDGTDLRYHALGWRPGTSADGMHLVYERRACHPADWGSASCPTRLFVADPTGTRPRRLVPAPAAPLVPDYWDVDAAWSRARN